MLIPESDRVLGETTSERDLVKDAKDTDASKQTVHNPEKTNVNAS